MKLWPLFEISSLSKECPRSEHTDTVWCLRIMDYYMAPFSYCTQSKSRGVTPKHKVSVDTTAWTLCGHHSMNSLWTPQHELSVDTTAGTLCGHHSMKYLWTPQQELSGSGVTLLLLSGKVSRITIWRSIQHLFCIHPNPEMVIKLIEN